MPLVKPGEGMIGPRPRELYAKKVAHFRKVIMDCFTDSDMRDLMESMKKRALYGEKGEAVQAAKLILSYTCGKPPDKLEVSGPDGKPVKISGEQALVMLKNAVQKKLELVKE